MIKLNRIGYKLGLAGAVGILLAGGMVANQMMSEWAIEAANSRADRSQRVIDAAISANLNGRQIELAARNIRLATKAADVEKNAADLNRFKAAETKAMDDAQAIASRPDTKERLEKIKSLMTSYTAGVDELAKTQLNLLAVIDKRSAISAEWTKAIETQLASPALAKLDNKLEIEKLLHLADAKVNTLARHGLAARRHRRRQPDRPDREDPGRAQDQFQPVAGRGRRPRFAGCGQLAGFDRQTFPGRQ